MIPLAMLFCGANVAVHVADAQDVSKSEIAKITAALGRAIEKRTGRAVAADTRHASPCTTLPECLAGIRTRTEASDIVLLRIFGVPTRVRVIAELWGDDQAPGPRAHTDLSRAAKSWAALFDHVAADLFPQLRVEKASAEAQGETLRFEDARPPPPAGGIEPHSEARVERTEPRVEPRTDPRADLRTDPHAALERSFEASAKRPQEGHRVSWVPWVVIGSGIVAGATGIAFGISSRAARGSAEREPHTEDERAQLEDRVYAHGLAANILFGTAAVGVAIGAAWLLVESGLF